MKRYWVTKSEGAALFGVSPRTICNWCKDGAVQTVKMGRYHMVNLSDLTEVARQKLSA